MLDDAEPKVLGAVILALGCQSPERVLPLLPELATAADNTVRWAVITVAETLDDRSTLAYLISNDPDSYVRGLAKLALDRLATGSE